MKYVKVSWSHDFPDDPILYFSELDEDGYEVRKVQVYRDGRSEWADANHETATVGLAEISFPPVKEISGQPDISAELITRQEFESVWSESLDME